MGSGEGRLAGGWSEPGRAEVRGVRQVRAEVHYTVNIDEEDGCYWAEIVEIPGFFVWGRSMGEIRDALAEAIQATAHSYAPQVVLRDFKSLGGDAAASSHRSAPSRFGRPDSARMADHPVLSSVPAAPMASEGAAEPDDDGPLAELVVLAGRRPLQS
jgi:predicted RNase H-like HicB family nuclease